jgi:carboxylesterase
VLQHGFTSCPRCFGEVARQLHALGHTVLLPRLPGHGMKDRSGAALRTLTADQLMENANDACDVAAGLGERVVYCGLSLGGVVAAWVALHRADVARVVMVAPLFAVKGVPLWFSDFAGWLGAHGPAFYVWWDRKARDKVVRPEYAYPGFPNRAGGAALTLGWEVRRDPEAPAVRDVRLVENGGDPAVNYGPAHKVLRAWGERGASVRTKVFPAELRLLHDFISPEQVGQRTELTYPALIDWITAEVPST